VRLRVSFQRILGREKPATVRHIRTLEGEIWTRIDKSGSLYPLSFSSPPCCGGRISSGRDLSPIFKPETAKEVLGLLAAAAVAIVPVGFLISTLSVALLRVLWVITRSPTDEAVLSDSTLERIWDQLASTQAKDKKLTLYAAATFDHELLAPGIHKWLIRRWNSFNVATHSIVALVLAHAFAPIFSIPQVCAWWVSTLALVALLLFTALNARHETMGMIEFQSYRLQKSGAEKDAANEND
jgi:hypothetical protein